MVRANDSIQLQKNIKQNIMFQQLKQSKNF